MPSSVVRTTANFRISLVVDIAVCQVVRFVAEADIHRRNKRSVLKFVVIF
nr:MAG TPA: hypothetical protein [Caudoviricetes sp.]